MNTYNIETLDTPEKCRQALRNAARAAGPIWHRKVLLQLGSLEERNFLDPLEGAFIASLVVSEQIRTEEKGRTIRSNRVRNRLKELGGGIVAMIQMLEKWAIEEKVKDGFDNLRKAGVPEYMAEYIVAYRFPERFSRRAVIAAESKLAKIGIARPQSVKAA